MPDDHEVWVISVHKRIDRSIVLDCDELLDVLATALQGEFDRNKALEAYHFRREADLALETISDAVDGMRMEEAARLLLSYEQSYGRDADYTFYRSLLSRLGVEVHVVCAICGQVATRPVSGSSEPCSKCSGLDFNLSND